jgi:hypothetical protein
MSEITATDCNKDLMNKLSMKRRSPQCKCNDSIKMRREKFMANKKVKIIDQMHVNFRKTIIQG